MTRPQSLSEWQTYIQGLTGRALFSQATAANSHTFARTLLAEGATMAEVEQVLLLFTRQLRATETRIPEGGPFDLRTMALTDNQTAPMKSVSMGSPMAPKPIDDLDLFDAGAEN